MRDESSSRGSSPSHDSRSSASSRSSSSDGSYSTPRPSIVKISHLVKDVNKDHISEIFGAFGTISNIDVQQGTKNDGGAKYAVVVYENRAEAEQAIKFMDGGQIGGQEILVNFAPELHKYSVSKNSNPNEKSQTNATAGNNGSQPSGPQSNNQPTPRRGRSARGRGRNQNM